MIPRLGRSTVGGHGNPIQYSCLENPMGKEAWAATGRSVAKSQTRLKRLSTHTLPEKKTQLCILNMKFLKHSPVSILFGMGSPHNLLNTSFSYQLLTTSLILEEAEVRQSMKLPNWNFSRSSSS